MLLLLLGFCQVISGLSMIRTFALFRLCKWFSLCFVFLYCFPAQWVSEKLAAQAHFPWLISEWLSDIELGGSLATSVACLFLNIKSNMRAMIGNNKFVSRVCERTVKVVGRIKWHHFVFGNIAPIPMPMPIDENKVLRKRCRQMMLMILMDAHERVDTKDI